MTKNKLQNTSSTAGARFLALPLWFARAIICGLLLAAPWPYAMADWSAQIWLFPIVGTVFVISVAIALWQGISVSSPPVWSLAAILLVGFIQITPLPQPLIDWVSPTANFQKKIEVLADEVYQPGSTSSRDTDAPEPLFGLAVPVDDAALAIKPGRTISIHPLQTRATLSVLATALATLISAIVLFRDKLSVAVLLGCVALSSLLISLLGIYQSIVASDWTFLESMAAFSFGTFFNRNSAPQFLACGFAATCGLLVIYRSYQTQRDARYQMTYPSVNLVARLRRRIDEFVSEADLFMVICLLAMTINMIAILVANSRGGILAFFMTGLVVMLVYSLGRQASVSSILGVLLLLLFAGLFLSSFELDEVIGQRLNTISKEAYLRDNMRLQLWSMALSQPSIWLLGSGLGTFHFAILPSYEAPVSSWFYHAENIYIELASGAGFLTLLLALVGGFGILWQLLTTDVPSTAMRGIRFASLFALLAVGLHNMVDFSLILPAVFLPLACLIGAFIGVADASSHKAKRRSRRQAGGRSELTAGVSTRRTKHGRSDQKLEQPRTPENKPIFRAQFMRPRLGLLLLVGLIANAVAIGFHPISGFAFAKQIEEPPEDPQALAEYLLELEDAPYADFPEVRLQMGRFRQQLAGYRLLASTQWPEQVTEAMRGALSQPEFFSAVFHDQSSAEMGQLRDFIAQQPGVLEPLLESQADMTAALSACLLDWRGSWGRLRADLGESLGGLNDKQRAENYARILLSSRNNQPVMQAAANHALMVGQTQAGLQIWKELLPVSGLARSRVANLLGRYLTVEQLIDISPTSMVTRIELARYIQRLSATPEDLARYLEAIDLEAAFDEADSGYEWSEIAWVAESISDPNRQIAALEKATLNDPTNDRYNYALAIVLQREHYFEKALTEIRRAAERKPENVAYQKLQKELEQQAGL